MTFKIDLNFDFDKDIEKNLALDIDLNVQYDLGLSLNLYLDLDLEDVPNTSQNIPDLVR